MNLILTPEIIEKIVNSNVNIEEFVYLWMVNNDLKPPFGDNINLIFNNYLYISNTITPKGKKLIEDLLNEKEKITINKVDTIDYKSLNLKLKERLQLCYGSKQVVGFGGVYFIPTVPELQEFLTRFWKNYPEMKDINKIMSCLENHIVNCSKKKSFAPAIKYFIGKSTKDGYVSQLAGAYENFEENNKEQINQFDGINI